jgi:hypothetical protein
MTANACKRWISKVLVPFFKGKLEMLNAGRTEGEKAKNCLLVWDVYHAHRDKKLLSWMKKTYPWIKLVYVIAGQTGYLQVSHRSAPAWHPPRHALTGANAGARC